MRWWLAVMALLGPAMASAGADCRTCHPAETKLHDVTRMAHALVPAGNSAFAGNLPDQPLREPSGGYELHYRKSLFGTVTVTAKRGDSQAEGVIEWVLGAGAQGQTPLVRSGDKTLESHVSYFPQARQYGITIGQEAGPSSNAQAALGVRQSERDLRACLGCHTTSLSSNLQPITSGVQCERCHSGAEEHAKGNGRPFNPGKISAIQQVGFCGNCHRLKAPVDDRQLENVRFQPLRLTQSRCFVSGKLKCTTCHVAHQDARRNDPAFYNDKCRSCHAGQTGQLFHADSRQTGDCIGCHMPYVQLHPALHFTDHFIRVVKPGDYPQSMFRQRGTGS